MDTKEEILARIFKKKTILEIEARDLLRKATGRILPFREQDTGCVEMFSDHARDIHDYSVLSANGKSTHVHRLIFFAAFPEISKEFNVLHKCNNPHCCRLSHLFAGTHEDNMKDKKEKDRCNAANHPNTKLTDVQVKEIRELGNKKRGMTQYNIAARYNVSREMVNAILNNRRRTNTK